MVNTAGVTADLRTEIWARAPGLFSDPIIGTFERVTADGSITHLTGPALDGALGGMGSATLDQYYIPSRLDDDPIDNNGQVDIYSIGTGVKELVGRLPGPGGLADPVPLCGSARFFANTLFHGEFENRISSDGRRIFFEVQNETDCDYGPPMELYMRDRRDLRTPDDDRSVRINAPLVPGEPDAEVMFAQASSDGSRVIYVTWARLEVLPGTPEDDNSSPDIYRYTLDEGNECLTCVVPNANITFGLGLGFRASVAVAEDLSRVYFASSEQLLPEVPAGVHIYRLRDGNLRLVGPATMTAEAKVSAKSEYGGQLSPDGRYLLFRSDAPELNAATGSDNGGFQQYYRYDDLAPEGRRLTCVSCPPGSATGSVPGTLGNGGGLLFTQDLRYMSDDGRVVAFSTLDALVAEDVNGDLDIYEWSDGQVTLLTDGQSFHPANARETVLDISSDGTNILIKTFTPLVPGMNADAGGIVNVRKNGGFPEAERSRDRCEGDTCQGSQTPSPAFGQPGSLREGPADTEASEPTFRVDRIRPVQRRTLARSGRLTLRVHASRGGTVAGIVRSRLGRRVRVVARASSPVGEDGAAMLKLSLSRAAQRTLRASGRIRLRIEVQYSELAAPKVLRITVREASRRAGSRRTRGR